MNNEKPFASLRNQKKILLKNLLPIWVFTIWPFCHDGGGAQVGCLTARDTVGASPVDAHARTGSDYGFRFQAGGDDCVPGQRSQTATRITILVSNFSAGGDACVPGQRSRTAMLQKICK